MNYELGIEVAVNKPVFRSNTIFVIGVSGGKDSTAAVLWFVHESDIFGKYRSEVNFCDIGNDHPWTIEHVAKIGREIHPVTTLYPELNFFDLALKKRRFPSTKARFCTERLKIHPTQDRVVRLLYEGFDVISVSGVRADESDDRANLPEWDYSGTLLCHQWRPLISWSLDEVIAIHKRHQFPLNPLYSMGAKRVGCWPCIMSQKEEIRNIAIRFPERIDEIRRAEEQFERLYGRYSSFFPASTVPERFRTKPFQLDDGSWINIATIDDVVRWSMTGKGARGSYLDDEIREPISCKSGFCE